MGILDQVQELKKSGMSEREIISELQDQGKSPKEIMDALNQSQIKEAVSAEDSTNGMTPSMMPSEGTDEAPSPMQESSPPRDQQYRNQNANEEFYSPQAPYESSQNQNYYTPQQREEEFYEYEGPQEEYQEEYYETEQPIQFSQNTTIEIAEQVFTEKVKKLQKQIRDLTEFKSIFEAKVDDLSERLKRMERVFDKMQLTIIDKVSGYGQNLDLIKKEMNMIEDSFAKIVNPIVEREEHKRMEHKK